MTTNVLESVKMPAKVKANCPISCQVFDFIVYERANPNKDALPAKFGLR